MLQYLDGDQAKKKENLVLPENLCCWWSRGGSRSLFTCKKDSVILGKKKIKKSFNNMKFLTEQGVLLVSARPGI